MSEIKIFNTTDTVYGEYIELTPLAKSIIDTPIFQALRFVKQLAFVFLLYMNANHTRYEHMVGTYHITKKWLQHLRKLYPGCIADQEMEWICIGGLCHDIGHGPFSHTFDHVTNTTHEFRSIIAFQYLVYKYNINISKKGIKFIEAVIDGKFLEGYPPWYFELVCNKKNNLDSDKFDYLRRDMFYCNIGRKPPIERIINHSRINSEGHICFLKSAEVDIETLYMDRYSMFSNVYLHPTIVSTETAILHPMLKVLSKLMKWQELLDDPFCSWRELDDTLITLIPKSEKTLMLKPKSELADWCFVKNCWDRILGRKLPSWKLVDSKTITKGNLEQIIPLKINFTLGNANPLDYIYWYDYKANMLRQTSEEVEHRIKPNAYEIVQHLRINLETPLTHHYDDLKVLQEDACIHNIYDYLNTLIAEAEIKGTKVLYNHEYMDPSVSESIILCSTEILPTHILEFCKNKGIRVHI